MKRYLLIFCLLTLFSCFPDKGNLLIKLTTPESGFGDGKYSYYNTDVELSYIVDSTNTYAIYTLNDSADIELKNTSIKFTEQGKYDLIIYVYDKTNKTSGSVSYSFVIDKTPPSIENQSFSKKIRQETLSDYANLEKSKIKSSIKDNLSGVNFTSAKIDLVKIETPETSVDYLDTYDVTYEIADYAGNKVEHKYKLEVLTKNIAQTIDLKRKKFYKPELLEAIFDIETPEETAFTVEILETNNNIFSIDNTNNKLTPLKDGTQKVKVKYTADPSVFKELELQVDLNYRYYKDTDFDLVKSIDFKGTKLPDIIKSNGVDTYSVTSEGFTFNGNSNEIKLEILSEDIGEFDYFEIKFKHSSSNTYRANFYTLIGNLSEENTYKLIYRTQKFGVTNGWNNPLGFIPDPPYTGSDDFITIMCYKISNTKSVVGYQDITQEVDFTADTFLYAPNTTFRIGFVNETKVATVTVIVDSIKFFKTKTN